AKARPRRREALRLRSIGCAPLEEASGRCRTGQPGVQEKTHEGRSISVAASRASGLIRLVTLLLFVPEEAAGTAAPASGVGATIQNIELKPDGSVDIWGEVVAEEVNCWRLASGRIAKKQTEGVKWMWAPVEEAPAEEVAEEAAVEEAAEEAPAEEAAEEAPAEEAPVEEAEAPAEEAPAEDAPADETIDVFTGVIYQVGAKTGNMLIKCEQAQEKFGQEAMIPAKLNPTGAVLGNKIQFEVSEGKKPGGRPIAVNVKVLAQNTEAIKKQIKYYFSDENLKKDRFFQQKIAETEGGYINMSVIMGCPAIKKIGCTMAEIIDALKDVEGLEVRDAPEGEEGIRRTTPPPPLEEAPGMRYRPELTKDPDKEDVFYLGTVKPPFEHFGSKKYFITCWEVAQQYNGLDPFFFQEQKPATVEPGQRVVFTVSPDNKPGFSPQAAFVAELKGSLPAGMQPPMQAPNAWGGGGGAYGGGNFGGGGGGGGYGGGYGGKGGKGYGGKGGGKW
ncbi:unnamed protein product, partial [Prorocentrum cordatum]